MQISSAGDLGDSVIALSIIAQIPEGPHDFILRKSTVTKMRTDEAVETWHRLVQPLFESQLYIRECRIAKEGEHADWSSEGFRGSGLHSRSASLFGAHLSHLIKEKGIGRDFTSSKPWLKVKPSDATKDRVIVARSGRYRNGAFPWQKVVDFYGDRLIFIGLHHEWAEFCGHWGMVEYLPTKDLLEVAQYIAGSLLFIGNQSSPMTVCEGLKHRSIQETSTDPADCIYKRDNAQYCYNGEVTLPGFGKDDLLIKRPERGIEGISTKMSPPGRWQFPGLKYACADTKQAIREMKKLPECTSKTEDEILTSLLEFTLSRVPDWQRRDRHQYHNVEMALRSAGYDR